MNTRQRDTFSIDKEVNLSKQNKKQDYLSKEYQKISTQLNRIVKQVSNDKHLNQEKRMQSKVQPYGK